MTRSNPATNPTTRNRTILISGASAAGPALAFWLHRYGFAVTVVEKAPAPRGGGYPIDVRGAALHVVQRMGILPVLRDAHIERRQMTFLGADGGEVVSFDPRDTADTSDVGDLEIRRGELAAALHTAIRDDVELLFNDAIDTLQQSDTGVAVTFRSGVERTFDLVIGADGMHSRTREFLFGREEQFHRYLGYCFAGFSIPNYLNLSHELVLWNTPGRAAGLSAVGTNDDVDGLLTFARAERPFHALRDEHAQRELVERTFADAGWEVPGMLTAMHNTDDLFFDVVSQIHMPRWSQGRVVLVGDAAYAPSFLTGQGTSLALVGAYMLADALAKNRDHTAAFAAYEHNTRDFVARNQALVGNGDAALFPTTAQALDRRNTMLQHGTMPVSTPRPAHSAITLPEFVPTS